MVVLLGPNGAGKSTLLKAIVGLLKRTEGQVSLNGEDVSSLATTQLIRKGIAYVPQVRNVFPSLTVKENLELGGYGSRDEIRSSTEELLELLPPLRKAFRRRAASLSGGERNLLALARGLMGKPKILLVDEPTAGLSPQFQGVVWEHLELIRQMGVSALIVEQNVHAALDHADSAYVLVLGETKLHGPAKALRGSGELAALFMGSLERTPHPDLVPETQEHGSVPN